jgi:hypothetical protein
MAERGRLRPLRAGARYAPVADLVLLALGGFLALAPWIFGWTTFAAETWNDRSLGLLLAALAVLSFASYWKWQEWAVLSLGLWILASTWVMGSSAMAAALPVHLASGLTIALLAGLELRYLHPRGGRP